MKSLVCLLALLPIVLGNLSSRYAFSTTLYDRNGDTYVLHWNFSTAERTITFAVNVSTTGWVGFGISRNGGMVNSDVVIGWVQSGQTYFHVSWCEMTSVACCITTSILVLFTLCSSKSFIRVAKWRSGTYLFGASLSEPHTSGTALQYARVYACLFVCGHIP